MAARIDNPALTDTHKLLEQILLIVVRDDSRALFLCDAGTGEAVLQRVRVMISRQRGKLARKGRRVKHFRLRSSIHPETHDGKRFDACVVWQEKNAVHMMSEDLEGILSNE